MINAQDLLVHKTTIKPESTPQPPQGEDVSESKGRSMPAL